MREVRRLRSIPESSFASIPPRARIEKEVDARVTEVYDGDTITVAMRLGGRKEGLYSYKVRLSGLDTPEMKVSISDPLRDLHKQAGKEVRDVLRHVILGKVVRMRCAGSDMYGRVLGTIFTRDHVAFSDGLHTLHVPSGTNMNAWLLAEGLALPYEGGTKTEFTEEVLQKVVQTCARITDGRRAPTT